MDFCPALDMANICIQLQATLNEQDRIDYPAWVQAIGTVVALGIAIAIPFFEHRKRAVDAAKQENLRLDVLASLFTLIEDLLVEVQVFAKKMADGSDVTPDNIDKLECVAKGMLERLKQVHISEASSDTQVYFIIELEHGLSQVGDYFMEIMENLRWDDQEVAAAANKVVVQRISTKIAAAKALKRLFLDDKVKV